MRNYNRRRSTLVLLLAAGALLCAVTLAGELLADRAMAADFTRKNLAPCWSCPFGTDWMGRDMLARTLAGLSLSIRIGVVTALLSGAVALVLGTACALFGGWVDGAISWVIDLVMGVPHILLVILISIACGRGAVGVTAGVALTHWPSLARLVRGEVLQLRQAPYVRMARRLGLSGLSKENIPDAMKVLREQGHLVLPLVVLIALMFLGYTPLYAAVIAIAATVAASWLRRETRMTWDKIVAACVEGARGAVSVGVCCVIIGEIGRASCRERV